MLQPEEVLKSLRQEEIILILALRNKFRFGEVRIRMRDGIPQMVSQIEVFVDVKERDQDRVQDMLTT